MTDDETRYVAANTGRVLHIVHHQAPKCGADAHGRPTAYLRRTLPVCKNCLRRQG